MITKARKVGQLHTRLGREANKSDLSCLNTQTECNEASHLFLGFLFCALQLGPFVSLTPGRVGNAVRHVGFFVYSIVVRALAIVASTSSAVWRALMMSSDDDGETTESRAAPVRH